MIRFISLGVLLLSFILSAYSYLTLPSIVPIHISFSGVADNYGSKLIVFIFPILICMFIFIFSKCKENAIFISIILFVIQIIFYVTIKHTEYMQLSSSYKTHNLFVIFYGIILIIFGILFHVTKMNSALGVKTYKSLKNETNWHSINAFSGKVSIIVGIIILLKCIMFSNNNDDDFIYFGTIVILVLTIMKDLTLK